MAVGLILADTGILRNISFKRSVGGRCAPLRLAAVILATAIFWAPPASAHRTKLTDALVQVDQAQVTIWLGTSAHDLAVALGRKVDLAKPVPIASLRELQGEFERYTAARLAVRADGAACSGATPDFIRRPPGENDDGAVELKAPEGANPDDYAEQIVIRALFACATAPQNLTIVYQMFFDIDKNHRAIGSVEGAGPSQQFLFDRAVRQLTFRLDAGAPEMTAAIWLNNVQRVVQLGIEHILLGYDHLLFLGTLLMVIASFWGMVKVVTAFTVSHSLTLALAWFGVIDPPSWLVETAIAVSIAYVAVENLLGRAGSHRWMLAAGFGLVHGLGFYGVLKELELGQTDVVSTLFAFNLGVEIGQVAVLMVLILPLVWWWRQPYYTITARALNLVILAIALWWAVERSFLA